MSKTLHIFISDDSTGETIICLKEAIDPLNASQSLQTVLNEPYLISRLINDAQLSIDVRKEMVIYKHPRYQWSGK